MASNSRPEPSTAILSLLLIPVPDFRLSLLQSTAAEKSAARYAAGRRAVDRRHHQPLAVSILLRESEKWARRRAEPGWRGHPHFCQNAICIPLETALMV